ncbi:hypothetical protein KAN5_33250 [Pseudoalteromonas sp. KAN5]|nr:hypothetical protein KAN5_33250 [Pseudoalteromonas sp. KAN5]
MSNNKINVKALLERLGYDFTQNSPSAYAFALALEKLGFDEIRITQMVSLKFPIEINF